MRTTPAVCLLALAACTSGARPAPRPSPLPRRVAPPVTDVYTWPARGSATGSIASWRAKLAVPGARFVFADRSSLSDGAPVAVLAVRRAGHPPELALAREPLVYECVVECFVTSYVPAPAAAYVVSWLVPYFGGRRRLHLLAAPGVDGVVVNGAPVQVTDGAGAATLPARGTVTIGWRAADGSSGEAPVTFAAPTCRWCGIR